jgi:hypothetical protein
MKQLAIVLAIAVGVLSCSKIFGAGKERKLCEHIDKLCEVEATGSDLDACAAALSDHKADLGEKYDKFLTCGTESNSCMEALGCAGGLAETIVNRMQHDFEQGAAKMK